jgi:hypothetical protein
MVFYEGVMLKGVSNYGARCVEDRFVNDFTAAVFRWLDVCCIVLLCQPFSLWL